MEGKKKIVLQDTSYALFWKHLRKERAGYESFQYSDHLVHCSQGMKDYADQQRRLQQEIKGFLERNQQGILEREEEERRQMEERAQVEMTARASVQSIITSAQEAVQAHPEVRRREREKYRWRGDI